MEQEKDRLTEQVQQLTEDLNKMQQENAHLRGYSEARDNDFNQQLEGTLLRLEAQTAELARKLDDASTKDLQADVVER